MAARAAGVNFELAAAVRRVNARYFAIPDRNRPDVTGERWRQLEATIDRAAAAGDRDAALAAIDRWERHARGVLDAVSRGG